ncbi:MAG: hypothetical protein H0T79_21510 [Deltaproteobacteria bacterium]|nr:hypothetical protein [Deltaproteobacteria bacterium]
MADINEVVTTIESFLRSFSARGATAVSTQVRASGDDVDVIKVWVDLGPASAEIADWTTECEAALAKIPGASEFDVQVRVEKL